MIEIIAEVGSNHNGSLQRAYRLIDAAHKCGANAVKFQLFKSELLDRDTRGNKERELPLEWIPLLYQYCQDRNIEFMCTPFYVDAVSVLAPYVKRWKVASGDITFTPLLQEIGKYPKPVLLSTAAATDNEIEKALESLGLAENRVVGITLLHCTFGYPTPPHEVRLRRIVDLGESFFPTPIGFSSHIPNVPITLSSILYGAELIEVHFDLEDKKGWESPHSFSPKQLEELVVMSPLMKVAIDCNCKITLSDQLGLVNARRSPDDWLRPVIS